MRLTLLFVSLTACTVSPEPEVPEAPGVPIEPTAERLTELTLRLTELGPRLSGTAAEGLAAAAVERMFREAGLTDVSREPFTWDAWQPGPGTLTVGEEVIPVEALSPSQPAHGLTLRLVDPAQDDPADALVLVRSEDGSRAEQFLQAATTGATAMIRLMTLRDHDGTPLIEVGHTLEGTRLLGLTVDHAHEATLESALGSEVQIDVAPVVVPGHRSENVVGRLPGTSGRTIYLVAHYDSWHLSESAIDNALGVGMLALLAADLVAAPREHELVFLATAGEEQGLRGARAWVEAHAAEIGAEDLVITLDIPWAHEGRHHCGAAPDLHPVIEAASEASGVRVRLDDFVSPASDHLPFQLQGASAVWCTRQPDRHYHSAADTLDWLDPEETFEAWRFQRAVVEGLGGG